MKYHIALRIVHWLMAFSILSIFALGLYMTGLTAEQGKYDYYHWHKNFGMLILFLVPVRFFLRRKIGVPPLPEGIKPLDKKLSHGAHILLYCLMLGTPLIGYIFSSSGGYPVPFFGITVPNLIGKNEALFDITKELHELAAFALIGVVALHVAGALKHRLFEPKENDVLKRML